MSETKQKRKFNFSIVHLFVRFLLTGVLGIVFGIAMFPFMRSANGLLFEQRAAIGGENMLRAVLLWGLFTFIVALITFWRKHFRLVSVLLGICWLISIAFYMLLVNVDKSELRCLKSSPYQTDKEFDRALDLIAQRMNVENTSGTVWNSAFNYRNCINVEYSELNTEVGTEGLFLEKDPTLQNLSILINPSYKTFDDLTIATILSHELVHAGQYINKINGTVEVDENVESCFISEAEAFTAQAIFLNQLNTEEIRSILARVNQNVKANPAFSILLDVDTVKIEAYTACEKLRVSNALTTDQFNQCVWTGTQNKLLQLIKEDPYYQKQCEQASSAHNE